MDKSQVVNTLTIGQTYDMLKASQKLLLLLPVTWRLLELGSEVEVAYINEETQLRQLYQYIFFMDLQVLDLYSYSVIKIKQDRAKSCQINQDIERSD